MIRDFERIGSINSESSCGSLTLLDSVSQEVHPDLRTYSQLAVILIKGHIIEAGHVSFWWTGLALCREGEEHRAKAPQQHGGIGGNTSHGGITDHSRLVKCTRLKGRIFKCTSRRGERRSVRLDPLLASAGGGFFKSRESLFTIHETALGM